MSIPPFLLCTCLIIFVAIPTFIFNFLFYSYINVFVSTHLWFKSGKNHRTFFALLVDQMFGAMSKPMTNITWNQLCTKVKRIFSSDCIDIYIYIYIYIYISVILTLSMYISKDTLTIY